MRRLLRSFYGRISLIYLLLILVLGAGVVAIAFTSTRMLFDEVEQSINRGYAASIAGELEPILTDGFSQERLSGAIHYMMVLNPRVEIYLLDSTGRILAWFADPSGRVVRERVELSPLRAFGGGSESGAILGDDPRSLTRRKPFSAAPLAIGAEQGWVYVILGGESYDASLRMIGESYYLRAGLTALLAALASTLVVGLSLFFLLTHRLASLGEAVRAFERGDLARRAAERGADEIGDLGRAFNGMAAAVEAGVERLRHAERMRRELVENISHDLRTPLASLRGHLETVLLKEPDLGADERRRLLEIGLKNADSLRRLVDELMELARIESGQLRPRRESFPLAELAQDVVQKLGSVADRAGVSLFAEAPAQLPAVVADIGMIERALTNLVENALRHTPRGGSVRLALSREGEGVGVTVTDTGSGIAPADLPRVFDRFYRGEGVPEQAPGGAGLGLAIARGIVELHGGRLEVENLPREGARFHFAVTLS